MTLLNLFRSRFSLKVDVKIKQKAQSEAVIFQKEGRIQCQNLNFLKIHSISFKVALIFLRITHLGT